MSKFKDTYREEYEERMKVIHTEGITKDISEYEEPYLVKKDSSVVNVLTLDQLPLEVNEHETDENIDDEIGVEKCILRKEYKQDLTFAKQYHNFNPKMVLQADKKFEERCSIVLASDEKLKVYKSLVEGISETVKKDTITHAFLNRRINVDTYKTLIAKIDTSKLIGSPVGDGLKNLELQAHDYFSELLKEDEKIAEAANKNGSNMFNVRATFNNKVIKPLVRKLKAFYQRLMRQK